MLIKNVKKGSFEPNFREEKFEVVDVNNGAIAFKSQDLGKVYVRNSTHLKKLENHPCVPESITNCDTETSEQVNR